MAAFFSISKPLKKYIMRILLGAVVTNMAGSVGGQTVRRSQNGLILYNKSQKRNTASISKNPQVRLMQQLMSSWKDLPSNTLNSVIANAQINKYTNTFGETVSLSTYNYYISSMVKLNIVGSPQTINLKDSSDLPSTDFVVTRIQISDETVDLEIETASAFTFFILKAFVTKKSTVTPNANQGKVIYGGTYDQYDNANTFFKLQSLFPTMQSGDYCTIFVQSVAYNGYSGGTTFLNKVEVIA